MPEEQEGGTTAAGTSPGGGGGSDYDVNHPTGKWLRIDAKFIIPRIKA